MTNGTPTTRLAKPVLAYDFFRFLRRPLIASLNFSPRRHIIKTDEGQRLVALARLFDEFLQARLDVIRKKYQAEKISDNGKKTFVPGKNRAFSSSFPENLRRDMEVSARFNRRSMNREIMERLLDSLNYLTEQQLPENEEVWRLRELAILFDEFISGKVVKAENPLTKEVAGEEKKEE